MTGCYSTATINIVPLDGTYRRLAALQDAMGAALEASCAAGRPARGECIPALERLVELRWGVPLALATPSGWAALYLAMAAAGVRADQEVVVPALAPSWTLLAIRALGAVPRIVDIERETLTIDPGSAREAILLGQAAALLAPYAFGLPPDMPALMGLSAEGGVPVIEDVTEAPGVRWERGRYAGMAAGQIGHFGYLSLSYGDPLGGLWPAGLLLCRHTESRQLLHRMRGEWEGQDDSGSARLERRHYLRDLDALCLQIKLERLADWRRRQRDIAARYADAFADLDLWISPLEADWERGACCYPVITAGAGERAALATYLAQQGIQTGNGRELFLPIHCAARHQARTGRLATYESVVPSLLLLPCYAELEDGEVEHIIRHVQRWYTLQRRS